MKLRDFGLLTVEKGESKFEERDAAHSGDSHSSGFDPPSPARCAERSSGLVTYRRNVYSVLVLSNASSDRRSSTLMSV